MMELSIRLKAVADLVTPGLRLADIGTDHAYIPIYLVEQQIIPSAIAMDINKGPLGRAETNIKEHGLDQKIQTRLSDGLERLDLNEADTMIAAGMGGALVIKILSAKEEVTENLKELILQPQSEIWKVREYLCTKGYRIIDEKMVIDDGKYYTAMKAVKGEAAYNRAELEYGPILLEKKDPVLLEFLNREKEITYTILKSLYGQKSDKSKQRFAELTHTMSFLNQVMNDYFEGSDDE